MKKIVCLVLILVLMLFTCTAFAVESVQGLSSFGVELLSSFTKNGLSYREYEANNVVVRELIDQYVAYLAKRSGATLAKTLKTSEKDRQLNFYCMTFPQEFSARIDVNVGENAIMADLLAVHVHYYPAVEYEGRTITDTVSLITIADQIKVRDDASNENTSKEDTSNQTDESGKSGGGYSNHTPRPAVTKRPRSKCHAVGCNGGKVMCRKCNGKGYKTKTVSVPNYSGKGKTTKEVKEYCSCSFGYNTCSVCGGDGWVND